MEAARKTVKQWRETLNDFKSSTRSAWFLQGSLGDDVGQQTPAWCRSALRRSVLKNLRGGAANPQSGIPEKSSLQPAIVDSTTIPHQPTAL
ncbi:hypothetical protein MTP99_009363 [Tenebrio molitor]|nr:hypothetical protein MTP99_009363 [Tenebrio molitor]